VWRIADLYQNQQFATHTSRNLAVVVFANFRQNVPDDESPTAEADRVARDVLFALFYNLP